MTNILGQLHIAPNMTFQRQLTLSAEDHKAKVHLVWIAFRFVLLCLIQEYFAGDERLMERPRFPGKAFVSQCDEISRTGVIDPDDGTQIEKLSRGPTVDPGAD